MTPEILHAATTAFRVDFEKGKTQAESIFGKVATEVPSSTTSNTFGWLGDMPNMKEWIGDRVLNDVSTHGYTITNKDYESTVQIPVTTFEDDQIGVYKPVITELGRQSVIHPNQLVYGFLARGNKELCYDGKPFFSTSHPVGDGTVSNFDEVADGTPWYVLATGGSLKPIIFQKRKDYTFTAMNKADDESVFTSNKYRFGIDSRCNVGFGFWQMAYCSQKPLTADNFDAVRLAIEDLTNDEDVPLGLQATVIVVPPSLKATAEKLFKKATTADGDNHLYNAVEVISSAWLNAPIDTAPAVKSAGSRTAEQQSAPIDIDTIRAGLKEELTAEVTAEVTAGITAEMATKAEADAKAKIAADAEFKKELTASITASVTKKIEADAKAKAAADAKASGN